MLRPPPMLERFSSDLYRPGFLAGRAHPNQAAELRASRSFARKVPIGGGHFPRGAAVGTQSQAPCDLAIDQSNPGALSFEENGASEEPQSPPAREMLGNYSYNDM